jgi:hypothetical protein
LRQSKESLKKLKKTIDGQAVNWYCNFRMNATLELTKKANQAERANVVIQSTTMKTLNKLTKDARAVVSALKNHKGQHILVTWQRDMKTRADVPFAIVKRTCAYVRAGIDYANLASVKEGIEAGERNEVQPLPWGVWVEFPFIIAHKGNEYLRLYPATFGNLRDEMRVEYVMDGVVSTKEQVAPYCLASEFRERDEPAKCFTIKMDSLLSIGNE